MLPARGLLAATAVLLLLVGGVWFSNRQEAKKQDAPAADAPPRLLSIPVLKLRSVTVDRGPEHFTVERSDKNEYKITEPTAMPADIEAATGLFLQFSALDTERLVDAKPTNLAQYGLDPAKATFTGTRIDGTKAKILLGEKSPTGTSTYAKVDGDPRVATLSEMIASGFEKSLKDLRDKRLIPFDRGSIKSVSITGKGAPIDLTVTKTGWLIGKSRAEAAGIEDLLRQLDASRMDPAATADTLAEAAKTWATATPAGTVRVTDSTGAHQLEVRRITNKDKGGDVVYLKSPAIEGIHKGTPQLADALAKPADQYLNLHLFDFGFDDPSSVVFSEGAMERTFLQADAKWTENRKPLDSVSAQSLVDKLRELKATGPATNGPPPSLLAKFSVVSASGQRAETVMLFKSGDKMLAKRDDSVESYALDPKGVTDLLQAAHDVKAAPPAPAKK